MLIDSKGKLFGKISIIDILIVLIIVGGIAGFAYKMKKSKAFTQTDKVQIVFYTEVVPEYAVKNIKIGDEVKDKVNGTNFGKITDIDIKDSKTFGTDAEGKTVASPKPGSVSIKITVEGKGVFSKNGVTIGTSDYYIYKSFETRFGMANFTSNIYDIKKLGE